MIRSSSGQTRVIILIAVSVVCTILLGACAPYQAHKGSVYYKERGKASWYGPGFAGRKTANGERFNPSQMTAAHKKLPFNTTVRVTNVENGKSVIVRINDRGPYAGRRIIDLSKAAAKKIGLISSGVAMVDIEAISPGKPTKAPAVARSPGKARKAEPVMLAARGRVRKNGVEHLISVETARGEPLPDDVKKAEIDIVEPAPELPKIAPSSTIEDRFVVTASTSSAPARKSNPRIIEELPAKTETPAAEKTYSVNEDDF